jgi:hypothetical protein
LTVGEHVKSAIRLVDDGTKTVVYTDAGRWLLVSGYHAEYRAWLDRMKLDPRAPGPIVDRLETVREVDKSEFYRNCATVDPAPYREELTAAGPQLLIPGCERKPIDNGKPAQLGLFG